MEVTLGSFLRLFRYGTKVALRLEQRQENGGSLYFATMQIKPTKQTRFANCKIKEISISYRPNSADVATFTIIVDEFPPLHGSDQNAPKLEDIPVCKFTLEEVVKKIKVQELRYEEDCITWIEDHFNTKEELHV